MNETESNWQAYERMGMEAFPAFVEERRLGGVFRAAGGLNYRNSSVTLLDPEAADLDTLIAETQGFSEAHGIEPVLRVPRLWPRVDENLAARGWTVFREAGVYDMQLPQGGTRDEGLIAGVSVEGWLAFQLASRDLDESGRTKFREIMLLVPERAGRLHYRLEEGGDDLASAMLWIDGSYSALMNMIVSPAARGKGIGKRFLAALLEHAAAKGCTTMWLQVYLKNSPAIALYENAGFRKVYEYAYWRFAPVNPTAHVRNRIMG